jgi:lysozyme family protein
MTVDQLISDIIRREGGYSNRAADRGGPTNWGITQATLAAWRGAPVSAEDVQRLTQKEAREIYLARYVLDPGFDAIRDEQLRGLVVDWGVNSGPDNPVRAMQKLLRVPVDGLFGPRTRAALALCDQHTLYIAMVRERTRELVNEAIDDPDVVQFLRTHPRCDLHNLRGWVNRCLEFVV